MRFLLINVPVREDKPPNAFPIGLGMIAAVLEQAGYAVTVLDANALRLSAEETAARAVDDSPDVIGISGLVSTYKYQTRLIEALKARLPEVPIVAGGGCATSIPGLMAAHTAADFLVIGEGEHAILDIARTLETGGDFRAVPGIVYQSDGETIFTEPRLPEEDLDRFPMPAYHLFPVEIYMKNPIWQFKNPAINIISSRGCPMSCRFCYNLFGRRSYRRRGVESIVEEIRRLKRDYGIRTVAFVDDNVTINKKHLGALCEALAKEEITWGCHGRVDTADDERLSMMAAAGCTWLGFGIESGSERILKAMDKRVRVEQAKDAILRTRAHGIFPNTTYIFGYPGEDLDSIGETLRFKLDLDIIADGFFATPYPGTELYAEAREKGLIGDENAYALSLNNAYDFTVNLTEFTDESLFALKESALFELKVLSVFKHRGIPLTEEQPFLDTANKLLAQETTLLPEAKGIVLLRLADYYAAKGDLSTAFQCRSSAFRFGASMDMLAPESESVPEAQPANRNYDGIDGRSRLSDDLG